MVLTLDDKAKRIRTGRTQNERTRAYVLGALLRAGDEEAFAEVSRALTESQGFVSWAAEVLGVQRRTLHNWLRAHKRLRRAQKTAGGGKGRPPSKAQRARAARSAANASSGQGAP